MRSPTPPPHNVLNQSLSADFYDLDEPSQGTFEGKREATEFRKTHVGQVFFTPEMKPEGTTSLAEVFPWLLEADGGLACVLTKDVDPSTRAAVAAVWCRTFADKPLWHMAPCFQCDMLLPAISIDHPLTRAWLHQHSMPLMASASDLRRLDLPTKSAYRQLLDVLVFTAINTTERKTMQHENSPHASAVSLPPAAESFIAKVCWQWALSGQVFDHTFPAELTLLLPEADATWTWLNEPGEYIADRIRAEVDSSLSSRDRDMIFRRFVMKETLEEIGKTHDLTRERVRQITQAARKQFGRSPYVILAGLAIEQRFGLTTTTSRVLEALPFLSQPSGAGDASILQFLDALHDSWVSSGMWWTRKSFAGDLESSINELIDDYGTVPVDSVAAAVKLEAGDLIERVSQLDEQDPLASVARKLSVHHDHFFVNVKSRPDMCAAALNITGRRMSLDDMSQWLEVNLNRGTGQVLSEDPRVHRTSKSGWELVEWGGQPYTNIKDWIGARVDANGGIALSELMNEAPAFEIAPNSVAIYANSDAFETTNGFVTRKDGVEPSTARPEESSNLYMRDGLWQFLATITSDHVRGSGSNLAPGLAAHHGILPGDSRKYDSCDGEVTLSLTGTGNSSISTIRRFLEPLGLQEGDRAWLCFDPKQSTFSITPATARQHHNSVWKDLANLLGCDDRVSGDSDDDLRAAISIALGLDEQAPLRRVCSRLRHRRLNAEADALQSAGTQIVFL